MHNRIAIMVDSASDITSEEAQELGISIVRMHINMGNLTLDDGTFPVEDICAYYDKTGRVPTTSASSPYDFEQVIHKIHNESPEKKILYIAYSAVTTCAYRNAQIAAEDLDFFYSVDSKHVSHGYGAVVRETVKYMNRNPNCSVQEVIRCVEMIREKVKMHFVVGNLDFLRAGGRISNSAAIAGNLLHIHPCIEITDGRLWARKKYLGSNSRVVQRLLQDYFDRYDVKTNHIYLLCALRTDTETKETAEAFLRSRGYTSYSWNMIGGVITCHGGPTGFGLAAVVK